MNYLGMVFLAVALLGAAAPSKDVTITVNGEGTISRQPDTATLSLGIVTTSDLAETATTDNNSRFNDLRNRLHALGIDDSAIRTMSFNVNHYAQPVPVPMGAAQPGIQRPMPPYPYPGGPVPGYTVTRSVQIKITNLDLLGKAVDAAVAANISNVYNVGFSISNYRALYAVALKAAVLDAQVQAKAMAEAASMHVVRITAMQQGGYYGQPMMTRSISPMGAPQAIATELQGAPIDVRATVSVTYVIAPYYGGRNPGGLAGYD